MRPSFAVLRHLLFVSFASTSHGYFDVQNDRSVLGINNQNSGVCYTYVSVYPVLADLPDYITITKPYRGSITTSYTVPPQGDEPGIVIIEQPGGSSAPENIVIPATDDRSYVIIIRPHQGPNPISAPITQVVPPRSGQPGQIIIETPETQAGDATAGVLQPVTLQPHDQTGYVTVLRTISGTLASLQLITLSPTGTNRGSVIINVPASSLNRASPQALTLEPAEEGGYVTVIEPAGVSFTGKTAIRLTVEPSGGKPGTVIIQTPVAATLGPLGLETQAYNSLGSLQRLEGQTITLQPTDATGYVTIIEPAEGSVTPTAPIRTTIPPTGTKPGTVLIQTPPEGNNGRPGGPQATGAGGTAFPPTRTRPEGSISYTTITRGVPMGFDGSAGDEDDGSDDGGNEGSNGSQDGAGSDGGGGSDNDSGRVQGRPGQGDGDNAGPRQTLTIPPEGGNPGTVLVLTPDGPNNSQSNDNDESDGFPTGTQPTGDDGEGNGDNDQATGGSNDGNQGSSGGSQGQNGDEDEDEDDSNNDGSGSGSGSNSGSGSGRPGQGGSSNSGDSDGDDSSGTGRGNVQGSGGSDSGSSGSDDDETSGNGGSSGSNSGNTSGKGGSSSSDEDDTSGNGGSSGDSDGGNQGGSGSDDGADGDDATDSGGSSGGSQGGSQGGSGSNSGNNGQGGSNTRSSSSPGKTGGASSDDSEDSGEPAKGDTQSEGGGSSGDQDPEGGSSGGKGNTSSGGKGSDNEDDPDFDGHGSKHGGDTESESKGGSGSNSGGSKSSSNGGDASETGGNTDGGDGDDGQSTPSSSRGRADASTAGSRPSQSSGSDNNQNSESDNNGRGRTSQRRTTARPQVIRTSPATFTVTSSNTVITITADIVTTLPDEPEASETDDGAGGTRTNTGNRASRTTSSRSLAGELEGLDTTGSNSDVAATDRTTVRRPSNSRNVNSDTDASSTAGTNDEGEASGSDTPRTTPIPEDPDDIGGGTRSSAFEFSTSVDTRVRPGGSGVDSTRRSQTTSAGQATRPSNNGGTDVNSGSGDETQSTVSRRPGASNSASSTGSITGRPENLGSAASDIDDGATSRTTRRSSRVTSSASDDEEAGPRSSASGGGGGDVSDEGEATTERPGAGSTSQTARASSTGSASTSARTSAATSRSGESTSANANTRVGGSSSTDRTATGSSRTSGAPVRDDDVSRSDDGDSQSQTARGSSTGSTRASQTISRGSSTTTSEEPFNFETFIGTQSVPESERVPQGDETSRGTDEETSDAGSDDDGVSATSTRGSATGSQATGTAGESSATDREVSSASGTNTATSGAESTASTSSGQALTARPEVIRSSTISRQDGSETTDTNDEDAEATGSVSSGEGLTGGSSGDATSRATSQGSPTDDDSEAGETSRSSDDDEVATGTQETGSRGVSGGATAGATSTGSEGDDDEDEDEDGETTTSRTGNAASQDPDAEETGEPSGPGGDDEDTSLNTPQVPVPTSPLPGSASDDASRTAELEGLSTASQESTFTSPQMPLPTGMSTGPLPDPDLLSSATENDLPESTPDLVVPTGAQTAPADDDEDLDPDSGRTVTDEPDSETGTLDPTETDAGGADETDSEVSGGATESGSPEDEGDGEDGDEEEDATESATATGGSGSGPGSNTDDDSQVTADNSQTTSISGQTANVTVFRQGQGPARTTVYIPPRSTNEPWTIVIETPVSETQSEAATARATDDTLTTAPAIGGNTNVTIFRAGTSPARRTFYVPPRAADEPGTIVIETPVTRAPSATATGANDEDDDAGRVSQTALETSGGRPNVTVYSSGTASALRTIYLPPASSGEAGTLIIETPVSGADPEETEDAQDDEDDEDEDDGSQTTPLPSGIRPNVTVYSSGTASTTRTIYLPPTAPGEDGTLIIETPSSEPDSGSITRGAGGESQTTTASDGRSYTTIFTQGTASTRNTIYFPPTASDEPGTFIIEVPASEVDFDTASDVSTEASGPEATITPAPSDDVFPDGNANLTLYRSGEDSTRRTIFIPPRTTGDPWTIVIETPVSDTQVEETGTASNFQTTVSSIGGSGNFTIFRAGPAPTRKTLYVPPKTTGEPGTVIIETPVPRSQTSGLTANPEAQTTAGSSGAGTNTTILVPGSGPGRTTFYVPPSGPNEPGTVYIETPTSEEETGDPEDPADITDTLTPGPDGIITEIPSGASAYSARSTTTIFSGGPGSSTRTIYIPPTATDEDGTLIIETPTSGPGESSDDSDDIITEVPSGATAYSARTTVTVFSDGPASTTRTIYIPPTASDEAGTLIIETPTPGSEDDPDGISTEIPSGATVYSARTTVTVTSGGPASVTRTIYIPPTVSGEPGTLIIETPTSAPDDDSDVVLTEIPSGATVYSARTTVTVTSGGPASVTRTIYIPPTASDEPGTLIVETPTSEPDNDGDGVITEVPSGASAFSAKTTVTVTSGGPASVTRTIYIPPTASDEAGTLVIETPTAEPDDGVITEVPSGASAYSARTTVTVVSGGPGSVTRSIYVPPTASDEAGTMYIETPTETLEATPADNDASGRESGVSAIVARTTVTVFSGGPGSVTRTVYVPPTASDEAGTMYIETPTRGSQTTDDDGDGAIVAPTTVTVFSGGPGSVTRTVYVPPTASGEAGTLYIETPTGSRASATDDENVVSARTTVTVFTGGPGSVTRTVYVPPTVVDEPGTLYIETPTGGSQVSATGEDEVISARTTVTIFSGGPGSVTRSTYIPPTASDEAGTLYIETPTDDSRASATDNDGDVISARTTVTIFSGGPGTITRTIYVPPTASGEAGTMYIETPTQGSPASPTDDDAEDGGGDGDGDDDEVISARTTITVTSGGPGSVTRTVYIPPTASDEPGTLIIEIPTDGSQASVTSDIEDAISARTTVTVFSGGPGSVTRTVYVPPTASGEAGTLIIETPTEASQATPTDDDGEEEEEDGNVISARTTVTVYSGGPGSVTRTTYVPPTASNEAGTLYIETPTGGSEASPTDDDLETITARTTVTIYSGGPASITRTVYIPPTASGEAGTLIIETPTQGSQASPTDDDEVEETEGVSETNPVSDSDAISARTTVTVFSGGPGSVTRTIYIPPTASGEAGTLIVETPTSGQDNEEVSAGITGTGASSPTAVVTSGGQGNVTIYRGGPVASTRIRFIPATASNEPGTVLIETPTSGPQATGIGNVTIVTGGPASVTQTRYIPATVTDEPGTIVIETPTAQVDDDESRGNVTIYSGVSATGTRTLYIPPTASDERGTIIIETPAARQRNTTVYSGISGSVTRTIFVPATDSDEPDTVLIETPTARVDIEEGRGNVTIYSGVSATGTRTLYIPPTASDERGTIIIETPAGRRATTIYSGASGSTTRTVYISATDSEEPDIVVIETPTSGPGSGGPANVTIYSGVSATVATTRFIPGTASDEPGTLIIETPIAESQSGVTYVTVFSGGPGTATTTIYRPPSASGEPGTAIIQTPTERLEEDIATDDNQSITGSATGSQAATPSSPGNVTIYSGGPGTVRKTIYIPPTASGERGTIVIETPTSVPDVEASESPVPTARTTATIFSGGPGTATKTIYIPPTASDEAGTVIIETPTSDPDSGASVTEPSAEAGTTITPTVSGGNVTIYSGGPASVTRTVYLPPAESGERGTVIIETPTGGAGEDDTSETRAASSQTTRAPSGGNVTIYTNGPGTGTARETFYFPPTDPDEPGTVIIETPSGAAGTSTAASSGRTNTTIYSGGPVTARRTVYIQATASGEPDTVFIETPTTGPEAETASDRTYTTIFGGGSGSTTRTITIPAEESGEPDTVLIDTPTGEAEETGSGEESATARAPSEGASDVTITRGGPGPVATTIYVPGESGQPGTVVIQTPTESLDDETSTMGVRATTTTITRGGPESVRTTVFIPGASGEPDTILVQTPTEPPDDEETSAIRVSGTTVTVTKGGPVTAATTITIPGESGEPGTVVVETPTKAITEEEEDEAATGASRTTVTVTKGGPVTAATTITIPGESGEPGTVVVETPTESIDEEKASATGGSQANVTITRGGPVSVETTIYIPPQSGEPGIVIIETPTSSNAAADPFVTGSSQANVTITRGGPVSAATTIYIPPQSGEPGVVIIETPTGAFETPNNAIANVTVYSGGPVTATRTIYVPPKESDEAGTVIIETPDGSTASQTAGSPGNITIYTGIPGTVTRTVFVPATASGEPGTVLIETPTGGSPSATGDVVGNVTIYSGISGTATRTVFIPATESGDIGTIIIETPTSSGASETGSGTGNITIYSGGPVTATRTIYIPPTASGEPGTVLIETPVNPSITGTAVANITIVSGGPGSVTQTRYIPPTASGEPGTIVIETPTGGSRDEETESAGITGTATRTLISPEGRPIVTVYTGVPGTVGQTRYLSATVSDEPDTILIQTPTGGSDDDESETGQPSGSATGTLVTPEGRQNTTIFSGGSGTVTRTIYFPATDPDEPGTVIIETPTGSAGDDDDEDEEEDEEETEASISGTATATVPASGSGRNVTITSGGPGTATRTIYVPPESSGEPGTIIIEIPTSTAGDEDEEEEPTPGASATATGTLVTPESRPNITITSGGSGSTTRTIYFPPASDEPDEPGTIVIETPTGSGPESESASETTSGIIDTNIRLPNVTIYSPGSASVTRTIYYPPRSDATDEPGTIIIETPASESGGPANVTRFVGGPASITTTLYIPPTVSGEPGTVVIQTPTAAPDEEEETSAAASETATNTRFPVGSQNVTSYRGGPGSVTTTIYYPPRSDEPDEPGTVVIQTPTSDPDEETPSSSSQIISSTESPSTIQNITRFVGGPASITTTIYIPPTASNEPGVVLIQTPSSSLEEETPSSAGVSTTTRTPAPAQNVTLYSGGPGSVTTTIYYPPRSDEPEEPGTVVIQTPTAEAQSGTSSAPISSTTTTTQRFPVGSQNVTVFSGGTGSTTRTIYLPPASEDEPGTVIIETPTATPATSSTGLTGAPAGISTTTTPIVAGTNVTIFRAAPSTATAERTLYEPPAAANEPGTVVVETLVVPSSTTSSTAVATSSTTSPAASSSTTTSAAASPAVSSTTTSAAAAVSSTTTSAAAAAVSSTTSSAAVVISSTTSAAANPVTTTTTTSSAVVVAVSTTTTTTTTRSALPAVPSYTALAFGPPFNCDGYGYVISSLLNNQLTQVNLADGSRTTLATNVGPGGGLLNTGLLVGAINGIGFNKFDGYIYGLVTQDTLVSLACGLLGCPQSQLIRIARNGRHELLTLKILSNSINMGDIDDQGRLWVAESGKKWWCIDVKPGSTKFGTVLNSGTSNTDLLAGVGDWSYIPGGGNYLYSVQASVIESGLLRTNIVRWSMATQKWERYQSYPNLLLTALNLIWGATMASPDGTLYAQENLLGQTWRFTLGSSANPEAIPGGAILNLSGDGARCIGAYAG